MSARPESPASSLSRASVSGERLASVASSTSNSSHMKLVHINIGLAFTLCWPLFSSGLQGALFASLITGVNIIRMLLLGLGVYQDEGTIKSMSRHGDRRELLKGPLCYALSITFACIFYWKTSPISIAVICNLCAGDGMADIVGRRLGTEKLPYNRNKSVAGSIGMAIAGFLASVAYMYYFASFGYIENSGWDMILRFFFISVASALVESLPISPGIDDNLTVSLTSALLVSKPHIVVVVVSVDDLIFFSSTGVLTTTGYVLTYTIRNVFSPEPEPVLTVLFLSSETGECKALQTRKQHGQQEENGEAYNNKEVTRRLKGARTPTSKLPLQKKHVPFNGISTHDALFLRRVKFHGDQEAKTLSPSSVHRRDSAVNYSESPLLNSSRLSFRISSHAFLGIVIGKQTLIVVTILRFACLAEHLGHSRVFEDSMSNSEDNKSSHDQLSSQVFLDLVDSVIADVASECHRIARLGLDKDLEVVEEELRLSVEARAKSHPPVATEVFNCMNCGRQIVAGRFAPHLERCMGKGRKARAKATRSTTASQNRNSRRNTSDNQLSSAPPGFEENVKRA
ncbi:hypothetical protein Bca101_016850 [Brassica carinata]